MGLLKPLQGLQPTSRNSPGTASCGASSWTLPAMEEAAQEPQEFCCLSDQALGVNPEFNPTLQSHSFVCCTYREDSISQTHFPECTTRRMSVHECMCVSVCV